MISAILVDDEKPSLIELEYLLKKEEDIKIINTFTDPVNALESISKIQPDVVFLDIDMPIINGLNAATEIIAMNQNIEVVFVTAFNEYAIKAFEVNALDYLLKPVAKDRLNKCLEKLRKIKEKKSGSKSNILNTIKHIEKYMQRDERKIVVWDDDEIVLLKSDDILFIETDSGNASIVTINKRYSTKNTMDVLEETLEEMGFFRCHRCYIINLKHINRISPMFNNNYTIILSDSSHQVPLGRTYVKKLKNMLGI